MSSSWSGLRVGEYLAALGSSAPTPGGGSAASLAGALAAALGRMVIAVAQEKEPSPQRTSLAAEFQGLEDRLLALAADDERVFAEVMEALRIPRDAPGRAGQLQAALERAADVPLCVAESAVHILERLSEAEPHASRAIVSDIGVAAHLALAVVESSLLNVAVNVRSIHDAAIATRLETAAAARRAAARAAHADVIRRVETRLAPKRA